MNTLKKNWFSESCDMWPGSTFSFEVKEVLFSEQSRYQLVQVFDTSSLGRVLVLDGIIQCTEKDEFAYQEMISFLPLCSHSNPEKVLIVGGGDGGVAREVAKHPKVKEIVQVEIDQMVIDVSKKYLPFMAVGFDSDKLTVHVCDGFEYLKQHRTEFDVVITDSSDPIGPATALFRAEYAALVRGALRPGGVSCAQAGSPWLDAPLLHAVLRHARAVFPAATVAYACVPSYPSGQIGFVLGSLDAPPLPAPWLAPRSPLPALPAPLAPRYYSPDMHRASLVLPVFVRDLLQDDTLHDH